MNVKNLVDRNSDFLYCAAHVLSTQKSWGSNSLRARSRAIALARDVGREETGRRQLLKSSYGQLLPCYSSPPLVFIALLMLSAGYVASQGHSEVVVYSARIEQLILGSLQGGHGGCGGRWGVAGHRRQADGPCRLQITPVTGAPQAWEPDVSRSRGCATALPSFLRVL
jgi:hypothetical protein